MSPVYGAPAPTDGSLGDLIKVIPPQLTDVINRIVTDLQPLVDQLFAILQQLPEPVRDLATNALRREIQQLVEAVKKLIDRVGSTTGDLGKILGDIVECLVRAVIALIASLGGNIALYHGGLLPYLPDFSSILRCLNQVNLLWVL